MNRQFRAELDRQLSDVVWRPEDTEAVMRRVRAAQRRPVRQAVILAAALAALIALMGIGYAEYSTGILSSLFQGRAVRSDAEDMLIFEPVTMAKDGIAAAITEYLYDGQTIHLAGEMRNDTEDTLLCCLRPEIGGAGSVRGVIDFEGDLVLVRPGETVQGVFRSDVLNVFQKMSFGGKVKIRATALRVIGEPEESTKFPGEYDWNAHYGTELTETVFDEMLSFPMEQNKESRPSGTYPAVREIRMEEYGYTLIVKTANFAAASSTVAFEVVPDDPKEILAYGDEGMEGHERLYRSYEVLNAQGERLFKGLTGGSDWGWKNNQTKLVYNFSYGPLDDVPEEFYLAPLDDEGNYLMDEAVRVPVE